MADNRFIDLYELLKNLDNKYKFEVHERQELKFLISSIQDSYKVLSNWVKSENQIYDIDTYIYNQLNIEDNNNGNI